MTSVRSVPFVQQWRLRAPAHDPRECAAIARAALSERRAAARGNGRTATAIAEQGIVQFVVYGAGIPTQFSYGVLAAEPGGLTSLRSPACTQAARVSPPSPSR